MAEIERDASAPEVPTTEPQPDGEEYIYLPGLLSDEFGLSRAKAKMEIATGSVSIDGEPYDIDRGMAIPKSHCAGKLLVVKGGEYRSFSVKIPDAA